MRKTSILIVALVVVANLAVWALLNRPKDAPSWTGPVSGLSFSPFQKGQDGMKNEYPSAQQIDQDLALVQDKTQRVRTYSSLGELGLIPQMAQARGLKVTAGAWLAKDQVNNRKEISKLISNANRWPCVERVIIGNESILRGDLTVGQLAGYIDQVRQATNVPVSTAEPWHVWIKHPELADAVDFIAIHVLPYWEGIPAEQSPQWALERYQQVVEAFPDKPVIFGEVGWPSDGSRLGPSQASLVNQACFVREFLQLAHRHNLDYFIMEAFDQPWKKDLEGRVGAHWGMFDANRNPKFPLSGEIVAVPLWPWLYALATLLALVPMILFLRHWDNLRRRGQVFFAALIQMAASMFAWTALLPMITEMTPAGIAVWSILLPAQLGLLLVVLTNGLELTEMLWVKRWKRFFAPLQPERGREFPMASIHLAIHNEPPELVFKTLDGLAALDYPNFEVLVIDNNTVNEEVWRPVEEYCARLGKQFRFFHLPKWPGYKAGALNFALGETHPDARVVGVIDADYVVSPDWLRALVPYFDKPEVGFVQAPQDNREWQGDLFQTMINWEYNGFFQIGMVHRNERNAIIQHGTMTLMRRDALEQVGKWGEWCICEDAELGLRLFKAGYESVYVNHNFGEGITPTSFAGYKGQRFRWTYGAVQILRRHWRSLLPWSKANLTAGQKFHFITGWMPWFTDALHLVFTAAGVAWTLGMLWRPQDFEIPLKLFLIPTLGLFVFKVAHALILYRARVQCSFFQSLLASVAGMGLTHTIARAIFIGLLKPSQPFLRTPKGEGRQALIKGVLMAWEETQIFGLLLLSAGASVWFFGSDHPEGMLWAALLLVQSIPYGAALATSMASCMPRLNLGVPKFSSMRRWWHIVPRRTPMR